MAVQRPNIADGGDFKALLLHHRTKVKSSTNAQLWHVCPTIGNILLAAVFLLIMNKIDSFLNDLNALLEQYNAAIVRSADENHKLVVSVGDKNGFVEYEFEEDITTHKIKVKDYKELGSRF